MLELHPDLKKTFKNDPKLLAPTRVKVLKSFCVGGKPVAVGADVSLPWHDAQSLMALGKCVLATEAQKT